MPGHTPASSLHRFCPPFAGSVRQSWCVVRLLPGSEEGHRQDARCIDLTTINPYLKYKHFKMEGLHTFQTQLRRREHVWKVDMSDFYMHLLIAEDNRLYFRFLFDGFEYKCTAMPFGLAPAPRVATKFLLPAIRYLCRRQV